ncbi:MAG: phosphatase PAP2 family protein [Rothia sp. (in: high G+C Gram-positive bacteria)]|nr:phosphatase PAP2 family protein [Rothia sp. (in: high G+C Gram-positive bacteria)]
MHKNPENPPASQKASSPAAPSLADLLTLRGRLIRSSLLGALLFCSLWVLNSQQPTNPLDQLIWQASLSWRSAGLNTLLSALTQAFNTLPMTIYVLLALTLLTWRYRSPWPLASLGGTMILAPLTVTLIKNLVDRPRPSLAHRLVEESTYSFPSGHSTSTAAFCLALFLTAYPALSKRSRRVLGVGLGGLALTIGFSRIYVGVHWASDVLAGLALGATIACLMHLLVLSLYTRSQKS